MRPFFFGSDQRRLFGAFYPADSEQRGEGSAVVLACPWMAEYNMSHWALRRLASTLAQAGLPVLRFDYSGTGDSSGNAADARCGDWVEDIVVAAHEVMELSGVRKVSVVGLGLGAALALEASKRQPFEDVVLWEPVVSGSAYLTELEAVDARQRLLRLHPQIASGRPRTELLGYPFSADARTDLVRIDMLQLVPQIAGRTVILAPQDDALYRELLRRLSAAGVTASLRVLSEPSVLALAATGQSAVLASTPLQIISAFLRQSETHE